MDDLSKNFDVSSRRVGDLEETVHSLYELHEQLADELLSQQEKVRPARCRFPWCRGSSQGIILAKKESASSSKTVGSRARTTLKSHAPGIRVVLATCA